MTRIATASSWARAPASWCSRNWSTPRRAGAKIYAEVIGYGMAGDAYHITAPAEDGDGGFRAMTRGAQGRRDRPARDRLHQRPRHLDAAGRRDRAGRRRAAARRRGLEACRCRSTKSATGHLLGAAGAIEAVFACLAIRDQIAPPTINLDNPSVETSIDLVAHKAKPMEINVALSNSFGFGGTNASVIFKKYK